jgi:hypothetical protein
MSSAFLYIAIVAIWAFVLIPRWLRRPHLLGGEAHEPVAPANTAVSADTRNTAEYDEDRLAPADYMPETAYQADTAAADDPADVGQEPPRRVATARRAAAPVQGRTRVLQARRRLLTVLVGLMTVGGVCVYLKLTSWWACIPPGGMLGIYLLLLREAALADAEQARWRAAESRRAQAARQVARPEYAEATAEVIDISDRLGDQLYDQYADATIRAVGD